MSNEIPANRPMTLAEWATLLFLSLLWGGSFFFNAVAVKELPVFTVVVGRVAVAAVLMLCLLRVMGLKLPGQRRIWAAFFGIGLLNNAIPFSLIVGGQQHIASGVASIVDCPWASMEATQSQIHTTCCSIDTIMFVSTDGLPGPVIVNMFGKPAPARPR